MANIQNRSKNLNTSLKPIAQHFSTYTEFMDYFRAYSFYMTSKSLKEYYKNAPVRRLGMGYFIFKASYYYIEPYLNRKFEKDPLCIEEALNSYQKMSKIKNIFQKIRFFIQDLLRSF